MELLALDTKDPLFIALFLDLWLRYKFFDSPDSVKL